MKLEDGPKHEVDVWALPLVDALMAKRLKKRFSKMSGELVSKEPRGQYYQFDSDQEPVMDYNETDEVVIEQALHRKRKSGKECGSALWVNGDV